MKTSKIAVILLSTVMLFNTSCCTILTGTSQKIRFQSNVDGRVYQNLTEIGHTNQDLKIKRRDITKLYTVKADGCTDKAVELPVKMNPMYVVDLLSILAVGAGLLFAYVDVGFESHKKTDKVVTVNLECTPKEKK